MATGPFNYQNAFQNDYCVVSIGTLSLKCPEFSQLSGFAMV